MTLRTLSSLLLLGGALALTGCDATETQNLCSFDFTATGNPDPTPQTGSPGTSIRNGDFYIAPNNDNSLGDGTDEFTRWIYDFRDRLDEIDGLTPSTMETARLQVSMNGGGGNDEIGIHGLDNISTNGGESLDINLLDHYSPQEIIDQIQASQSSTSAGVTALPGQLLMEYQDDALLYRAQMTLVFDEPCP